MKIVISSHSRKRYIERTKRDFIHLRKCNLTLHTCRECDRVHRKMMFYIRNNKDELDKEIHSKILNADEEKFLKNDNNFMEKWYNEHGYDAVPYILVDNDAVYIIAIKNNVRVLLTCIDVQTHFVARRKRNKLNHRKIK